METPKENQLPGRGLSAKLLWLTLGVIMLAEILVFVPSVGRSLNTYVELAIVELERGALAFEVLGEGDTETQTIGNNLTMPEAQAIQQELLNDTKWIGFAARLPENRSILTMPSGPPQAQRHIDLRNQSALETIRQALSITFDIGGPKVARLSGVTRDGLSSVDIWLDDAPIRAVLRDYAVRILFISLAISIFAAALVYITLRRFIVRPIERLRASLSHFAMRPQDPAALLKPSGRRDEIGFIEAETRAMQETIANTLQQKERLAALGSAVAQVNHDLRGMLSTALLLSDSLESSKDPRVAKAAPILADSIERAVELCSATLKFAKGADMAVKCQNLSWNELLIARESNWMLRWPAVNIRAEGPGGMTVLADKTAFARALDNLALNAVQAGADRLLLAWQETKTNLVLSFSDNGPGIPPKAQADLFVPFKGSTKRDGTGLGVTNALELMEAIGGTLKLSETGATGTTFLLTLPLAGALAVAPDPGLS